MVVRSELSAGPDGRMPQPDRGIVVFMVVVFKKPFFRSVRGRKPRLFLLHGDNSVRESNAQPAPATGLLKGFGVATNPKYVNS